MMMCLSSAEPPNPKHTFDSMTLRQASSSFLLLVVRPGAPSSVLAPSSKARSP